MTEEAWTTDAPRFTDVSVLSRLRSIIEDESPIIVEHRFYRGSRAPHRFICDDFDDLKKYLHTRTKAGDAMYVWRFEQCCRDDLIAERGKIPDASGRVPVGGAY
jgi:hypothetical protein